MPVVGSTSHDPKPDALDWIRLTAIPPASAVHRYVVSPAAAATGRLPARSTSTRPAARLDRGEQRGAVGPLVEHVGPVERGRRRRLDEEVRPARVVGVVGQRRARSASRAAPSSEVALRVRADRRAARRPNAAAAQRRRPSRPATRPGRPRRSSPAPSVEQALAERAAVERVAAAGDDGLQGERHAGPAHPRAGAVACSTSSSKRGRRRVVEQAERADEQRAGREAGRGQADRRGEDRRQVEAAEALVQRHPAVDAAGHGHRCGCRGATASSVRPSARSAAASAPCPARPLAFEADHLAVGRAHEGEQVATHPAQVRGGDGDRRVGGDRRVDGVAAAVEHRHRRLRGELVGRGGDRTERSDGAGGDAWRHRCRR